MLTARNLFSSVTILIGTMLGSSLTNEPTTRADDPQMVAEEISATIGPKFLFADSKEDPMVRLAVPADAESEVGVFWDFIDERNYAASTVNGKGELKMIEVVNGKLWEKVTEREQSEGPYRLIMAVGGSKEDGRFLVMSGLSLKDSRGTSSVANRDLKFGVLVRSGKARIEKPASRKEQAHPRREEGNR